MLDGLLGLLVTVSGNPLLLGLLLFGATFIAEDAATIAAGLLVARLDASPLAALAGVMLGTAAGDIALYAAGRWGAGTRIAARLRARPDVLRAETWLSLNALRFILAARFMPGCRLPVFVASGLARVPAVPVAAIIALTTPVWTAALFEVARRAGSAGAEQLAGTVLPVGCVALIVLSLRRSRMRREAPN